MNVFAWINIIRTIYFELWICLLLKYLKYFKFEYFIRGRKLDDDIVVITCESAEVSKSTALLLAQRGAKLVLVAPNLANATQVVKEVRQKVGNADIDVIEVDLMSLESIYRCAQAIKSKYKVIDLLVNLAEVWVDDGQKTTEGYEIHFGINYLSHFLFGLMLLSNIKRAKNGKIINVTTEFRRVTTTDLNANLQMTSGDNAYKLYANSKPVQVLLTKELAVRSPSVKVHTVDPDIFRSWVFQIDDQSTWLQKYLPGSIEQRTQTIIYISYLIMNLNTKVEFTLLVSK